MIRQAFGEENMSRIRKIQIHRDRKEARQLKSKVKSILIIFFAIKGIVHKESSQHNAMTFYGNYMKMSEDFVPNFGEK
jgi:hypothetical protein